MRLVVDEQTTALAVEVGIRIRELRRLLGVSQAAFATSVGMASANLSKIERGKMNLTLETMVRIARGLDVQPIDLFTTPTDRSERVGRPRKSKP